MKIGIITFHRAINYGAILQSYALTKIIEDFAVQPEIIDYLAPSVISRHKLMKLSLNPKEIYQYLRYGHTVNHRFYNFQEFLKNLPHSKPVSSNKELKNVIEDFKAVICGSDQVWNTEITDNDFHFFLDFVPDNIKKVAYAASFGFTHIPHDCRKEMILCLKRFNSISVREDAGAEIVEKLIGIRPPVVADPTLLLTAKEWRQVCCPIELPSHYILLYSVGELEKLFPIANEVSLKLNIPVVVFSHRTFSSLKNTFYLRSIGPNGFLYAFDKADYVITNSFHGTAFSVIFRKKFIVVPRTVNLSNGSGINSRMETLLNRSSLQTQFFSKGDPIAVLDNTNYTIADIKLQNFKELSINFLKSSLL